MNCMMCDFIFSIQLHLQDGGLHADINGDGVLDHVQVRLPQYTHTHIYSMYMVFYCLSYDSFCPIGHTHHKDYTNYLLFFFFYLPCRICIRTLAHV